MYSRYSTTDWDRSNKAHFKQSETERSVAQQLRADAVRTISATNLHTRKRQEDNTKKLGMYK